MIVRALALVVGVGAVCAAFLPSAGAESTASRIVDRTFACETGYLGGIYQATVQSYWSVPPQVTRRTPSATVVTNLTDGFLGGISSSSIYVTRLHCKATSAKLAADDEGATRWLVLAARHGVQVLRHAGSSSESAASS